MRAAPAVGARQKNLPTFKVVLMGDASVGKSTLVIRFTRRIFPETTETTVGTAFTPHTLALDSTRSITFELWDTAGQERFASLAPMYCRGSAGVFVVYDQSSLQSYERAKSCVKQVHEIEPEAHVALLANKADLTVREIPADVAETFAETENLMFFETSAKTGLGVVEAFSAMGEKLLASYNERRQNSSRVKLTDSANEKQSEGGCC